MTSLHKHLTKQQIFNLQIKYPDIIPITGSGKPIKNWWYDCYAWINVCMNLRLSEEFMREFKDYIVWATVSRYQPLSESFIREFKDMLELNLLVKRNRNRRHLSRKFKNEILCWICDIKEIKDGYTSGKVMIDESLPKEK